MSHTWGKAMPVERVAIRDWTFKCDITLMPGVSSGCLSERCISGCEECLTPGEGRCPWDALVEALDEGAWSEMGLSPAEDVADDPPGYDEDAD